MTGPPTTRARHGKKTAFTVMLDTESGIQNYL